MKFSSKQNQFLRKSYIARVASCGKDNFPHVSPVYFANDANSIFFATEKETRKFKDISENAVMFAVVDYFDADWIHEKEGTESVTRAIVISGKSRIILKGKLYHKLYSQLFEKYPDYRKENWEEGSSPIIRINARKITSWGV
jgi:nitroimidazol reductase NimA-like FMN-containing flavoprotein (pyridoxamine 5'-phosphate oxidase superfamily)